MFNEKVTIAKVITSISKVEGDKQGFYIKVKVPCRSEAMMLTPNEAAKLKGSLVDTLNEFKQITDMQATLGQISNYLDSLGTSLEAAEGHIQCGDHETAKNELRDMDSDMNDLAEILARI